MLHPRLFRPSGMAFSIATHLTVLTVGLGFAGVRPFQATPVEAIAVDIVTPDEVGPVVKEMPAVAQPSVEIADSAPKSAAPQQQLQPAKPSAEVAQAAVKQAAAPIPGVAPQPASWRPPEPDLTVKYQVNLGLPARPGEDFDAPASAAARVSDDHIARFRERLKTCAVLPGSVAPD